MLTTLRPGRTKALVQRKRRKAHIGSIGVGEQTWLTACNRTLPIDGTEFALLANAVDQIDTTDLCLYCAALYATADIFYDRGYRAGLAAAEARENLAVGECIQPDGTITITPTFSWGEQ